jgi:serine/threonine protein phosphatase PrpC
VIVGRTLVVANAGDSRAVICRAGGVAEPLSFDHKPFHVSVLLSRIRCLFSLYDSSYVHEHVLLCLPMFLLHIVTKNREMDRITNAGGFVNQFGRVNGNLNLSRSIGDLKYKQVPGIPPAEQMITAEPDVLR